MTSDDVPICWMVIAPRDATVLDDVAAKQYAKSMPYARQRHPWMTMQGTAHGALVSRSPGTEGADWTIAEIASKQLRDVPIYTVWFDDERAQVSEWRNGRQLDELQRDATTFVRELGFAVEEPAPYVHEHREHRTVAFVADATLDEVEAVLARQEDLVTVEQVGIGLVVHAESGALLMLPYDLSVALPARTVYELHNDAGETFSVHVLRAGEEVGHLLRPVGDPREELPDILGADTREEILAKLGIAPSLLGYE